MVVFLALDGADCALYMALAIEGAEQVLRVTASRCALVFFKTSEPYEIVPTEIEVVPVF